MKTIGIERNRILFVDKAKKRKYDIAKGGGTGVYVLTPAGITQSLYTSGWLGAINGNRDLTAVVSRKDSLITAV